MVAVRAFSLAFAGSLGLTLWHPPRAFPNPSARTLWILGHVALLGAIAALMRRHRPALALLLSVLLAIDAAATLAYLGDPTARGLSVGGLLVALASAAMPALTRLSVWALWRRNLRRTPDA